MNAVKSGPILMLRPSAHKLTMQLRMRSLARNVLSHFSEEVYFFVSIGCVGAFDTLTRPKSNLAFSDYLYKNTSV